MYHGEDKENSAEARKKKGAVGTGRPAVAVR